MLRFPEFIESWSAKKLSDVIAFMDSGWSPMCESYPAGEDEWGVLKTTSTTWNGFDDNENKKLPLKLKPRPKYEVQKNDILITRAGPTERVGVVCHVNKTRSKLILSDKLIRIKTKKSVSSKFLAILLGSSKTQNHLVSRKSGLASAQTNISQSILLELNLDVPDYEEQTKIANFLTAIDEKISLLTQKHDLLTQYKKGVMQQIFSQELRFKDEDGKDFPEWEEVSLENVLDYEQPTKYLVSSTEYSDSFKTPVLTAGKTFILGYTDETTGICDEGLPVIIFDDFTTAFKFVPFPFKAKSSAMKLLRKKANVNIYYVYSAMQLIDFPSGDEHKRYWISEYSKVIIPLPCEKEQTKIANFLTAIDDKITATQSQLKAVKQYKQGLLQQMFV